MCRHVVEVSSIIRLFCMYSILVTMLAGAAGAEGTYEGSLMIMIAEPDSRWEDYSVVPYNFGFLQIALDTAIVLDSMQSATVTTIWDASGTNYGDIQRDNIIAFAVIHNAEPYTGYSAPPTGNPFTAYWADAAAAATPDRQWSNTGNPEFTHTVFAEEGTATWCPDCPVMRAFLHSVFQSGDYPFFYTALVADKNTEADYRLWNQYNAYWIPICYYDCGYIVNWGGVGEDDWIYRHCIETAGSRPVTTLGLTAQMNWLGGGQIEVIVDIVNSGYQNIAPDQPSSPAGIYQGYYLNEFEFSSYGTDQDSEQLYYRFQWSQNETSDWLGPHDSGDSCHAAHCWSTPGSYFVKVQTQDQWNFTSYWSDSVMITTYDYFAGDPNGSGTVNILDCTYIINYLYKGGPAPNPLESGDVNGNGSTNILDVTYLINYLYKGGPAPVYPS